MTQEEFYEEQQRIMDRAIYVCKTHPQLRLGQCVYNITFSKYPKEAHKTQLDYDDPFYNDENIPRFWEHMEKELVGDN